MIFEILIKYSNVLEISQNNQFAVLKKEQKPQQIVRGDMIKNGEVFKVFRKKEPNENVNVETEISHQYVARSRSSMLILSGITKHSNYTQHFIKPYVNVNSPFA